MTTSFHEILTQAGIRPSVQRVAVYSYLCEKHNHPTADTVYTDLSPEYPTLSRTTIYNTLKLFEEHNLVQSIQIEDDKLRFDADTSHHLHFKCSRCGHVYDYRDEEKMATFQSAMQSLLPKGFSSTKFQTNIWGTCDKCQ